MSSRIKSLDDKATREAGGEAALIRASIWVGSQEFRNRQHNAYMRGAMTDPARKCSSDGDSALPEGTAQPIATQENSSADIGAGFPEAATETIAALLHLVKLMGGELVLNVAGGETERFERAVRTKIGQFTSPTANQAARKSGLAFATHLVEQVLTQLRAQAEVKRSLAKGQPGQHQAPRADGGDASSILPKFLN
jgi:hypothetical protein